MKFGILSSIIPIIISPKIISKEPMNRTKIGEAVLPSTLPPKAQITPIMLIVRAKPKENEGI